MMVPADVFERMVKLRRELHRNPELSGKEERSADLVTQELRTLGLQPRRVAGTGVVADLAGVANGLSVALRADLDALPIVEETGLDFASLEPGVMHACGHDGHTSMLLGAAHLLVRGGPLPAPVRLIWQPAEEAATGARTLIDAGVLDGVGSIFGGHVDRRYPAGVLVVTEGTVNASTDRFTIDVRGQAGHGARPHEAVDAIVAASLIVMAIQTIVSREVDPAHPAVISVGRLVAGTADNVIAGQARLEGTIRAQDRDVRAALIKAVQRIAAGVGQLHGATVEVKVMEGTPPLQNQPGMTAVAREAACQVVGQDGVAALHAANMGGEDFAHYLAFVPGCYIRFGARLAGREGHPAHSSRFDIDEQALASGAAWFAQVARVAGERLVRDHGRPHRDS
jgi:hippurate hydrolase